MTSTAQTDHEVELVAGSVLTGLTGNKNYPNPAVDLAALQQAISDFHLAIAAAAQGGVHATADKNKKRHDLVVIFEECMDLQSEVVTLQLSAFLNLNCRNLRSATCDRYSNSLSQIYLIYSRQLNPWSEKT
jgi:hypothetical protein